MLSLFVAGIQALDPFNRPSDGLRLLRDDEAENLRPEITLLFDTPTGSSTQPRKYVYIYIYIKYTTSNLVYEKKEDEL